MDEKIIDEKIIDEKIIELSYENYVGVCEALGDVIITKDAFITEVHSSVEFKNMWYGITIK